MSGIEIHYTKTAVVQRLTPIAGTDKEEYGAHIAALPCHIQPLDDSFTEDAAGSFGKDHVLFCAVSDIKEHDQIIADGVTYRVAGVEPYDDFLGSPRHMEIRMRRFIP